MAEENGSVETTQIITQRIKGALRCPKSQALYEQVIEHNFTVISHILSKLDSIIAKHEQYESQKFLTLKRISKIEADMEAIHNEYRRENLIFSSKIDQLSSKFETIFKLGNNFNYFQSIEPVQPQTAEPVQQSPVLMNHVKRKQKTASNHRNFKRYEQSDDNNSSVKFAISKSKISSLSDQNRAKTQIKRAINQLHPLVRPRQKFKVRINENLKMKSQVELREIEDKEESHSISIDEVQDGDHQGENNKANKAREREKQNLLIEMPKEKQNELRKLRKMIKTGECKNNEETKPDKNVSFLMEKLPKRHKISKQFDDSRNPSSPNVFHNKQQLETIQNGMKGNCLLEDQEKKNQKGTKSQVPLKMVSTVSIDVQLENTNKNQGGGNILGKQEEMSKIYEKIHEMEGKIQKHAEKTQSINRAYVELSNEANQRLTSSVEMFSHEIFIIKKEIMGLKESLLQLMLGNQEQKKSDGKNKSGDGNRKSMDNNSEGLVLTKCLSCNRMTSLDDKKLEAPTPKKKYSVSELKKKTIQTLTRLKFIQHVKQRQ